MLTPSLEATLSVSQKYDYTIILYCVVYDYYDYIDMISMKSLLPWKKCSESASKVCLGGHGCRAKGYGAYGLKSKNCWARIAGVVMCGCCGETTGCGRAKLKILQRNACHQGSHEQPWLGLV